MDRARLQDLLLDRAHGEHGARHHWDLAQDPGLIRVFLLPGWLELDLTFAPESHFGPRGPQWHTLFGESRTLPRFPPPDPEFLTGLIWHHALHARTALHRAHWWQAEHWISALRNHTITLACLRLGHPTAYSKGAHLLPAEVTATLHPTLVTAMTPPELHRALSATVTAVSRELSLSNPGPAARLIPMLADLTK